MKKFSRPSPATVISVIALVFALGGGAVAAGLVTPKQVKKISNKQISKRSKKLTNKQIDKRAPKLAVGSAQNADAPYAYARINANGTLSTAVPNRNVPNAGQPSAGQYCFDLPFTPVHAQGTGSAGTAADDVVMVELFQAGNPPNGCPAGTEVGVKNFDIGAATLENDAFYIQFSK